MNESGTIFIRPRHSFGTWLYTLFKARSDVDGRRVSLAWGKETSVEVKAGHHEVAIWSRWLMFSRMGYNKVDFDVTPGAIVEVVWTTPAFSFSRGSIYAQLLTPTILE